MRTIKARNLDKLLAAMSRIAAGRTDGKPLPADSAMALARSTLVSIGERVPAIHIPKREIYFKVERQDDMAVLVQVDGERAA